MIGNNSQSWATTLADLAIILFMITAADLANADMAKSALEGTPTLATAEPVAIYRPGGASLTEWLDGQPEDPRQRLTIVVHHGGTTSSAMDQGMRLNAEAELAGREARLIVERSEHSDVAAILAYDSDPKAVARKLLSTDQPNSTEDTQ